MQQGVRLNDTYILLEQIGSGGGGIVYKAYHERLKTYVVVKQIKDSVKGILEGRAEADILKNIKHSCLPQVYDFLEINGEVYTVMDYIPGESLDKWLEKKGRFTSKQVYQWALQLADALSYLHEQTPPVIHSDIKPANIMLMPDGKVCLIDFNVSLAFDKARRTSTGISGGYSPPEQYHNIPVYQRIARNTINQNPVWTENRTEAVGSNITEIIGKGVDERSDVYSLGATLYHLLVGVRPSEDFNTVIPITRYDMELGEGFGIIIEKMMDIDPQKRYQNGSELLDALRHVFELDTEYKRFRRRILRQKLVILAICAMGVSMLLSGVSIIRKEKAAVYNHYLEMAEEQIRSQDFDGAKESIQKAWDINQGRVEAYEKEAYRLYQMKEYEDCIQYGIEILNNPLIESALGINAETTGNLLYVIGNACYEIENYSDAVRFLQKAIEKNPENSLYFRDYAISLARTGRIEEAGKALENAVEMGLGEDSLYFAQGEIASAQGEYLKAIQYLEAMLKITEQEDLKRRAVLLCVKAFQNAGENYLNQEINMLEQYARSVGERCSMDILERLADAYARKAKAEHSYYEKAIQQFMELYEKGYSTRQMMENLAILYQETGELEQAESMLMEMIRKYPDDYRGYKRLAFLEADCQQRKLNQERNYENMRAYYEQAEALYTDMVAEEDMEMQMLENMMLDLQNGGWF